MAAKCNCEDPLREGECPVHPSEDVKAKPPAQEAAVVTAADRVDPKKKSVWVGFAFKCPKCKEDSIMHWGEMSFDYCPSCGAKIVYEWEQDKKSPAPTKTE